MRFLLALLLVFSVVIDDCTASSLLGTDTSDVQRKSSVDCYDQLGVFVPLYQSTLCAPDLLGSLV